MTPHGYWSPGGWRDFKRHFLPLAIGAVIIVLLALLWATLAHGQMITICVPEPILEVAPIEQWRYRAEVGGRPGRCWYVGRQKSRGELRWQEVDPLAHPATEAEQPGNGPSIPLNPPAAAPVLEPWRLDERWWPK